MGNEPVADPAGMSPDQLGAYLGNLRFEPVATRKEEAALLAQLPPVDPDAPITVTTSLRMPYDLKQRIDAAAQMQGVSASTFIRQAVESVLAGADRTNLVNLDDVIRAIKSVPHAA